MHNPLVPRQIQFKLKNMNFKTSELAKIELFAPGTAGERALRLEKKTGEVIILDEPFANLDPTTQFRLKKIIKDLADNPDVTVLVSSHDLLHTVEVSDRIVALNKGEVVKDIQTSAETLRELEAFFAV